MNIFLTGGTGFIGSHVLTALIKAGHRVTVLARNPHKIPALQDCSEIQWLQGTLNDRDAIAAHLTDKDACIHIALNYTKKTGHEVLLDDTSPTVWMADEAARQGVQHFIYTSSTACHDSVYMLPPEEQEEKTSLVRVGDKRRPVTFYGATKAASELYLLALSHQTKMRINIIRPGYTFGNPAIENAPVQSDPRFFELIQKIVTNQPVTLTQYDGTQFIAADQLAQLYLAVLNSDVNRRIYFGLSRNLITWERIARKAIQQCASNSQLIIEDKGWNPEGTRFDVSDMKWDFGLEFDPWKAIEAHISFFMNQLKKPS